MSHVTAISFGGGVQTVAMCVLAAEGRIARPDAIIFADTTRERQTTYRYLAMFDGWLRKHGLSITTTAAKRSLTATLEAGKPVIPMYGSQGGQLPRVCTERWKIRVVRKQLRELGATTATVMLGISWDEVERLRDSDVKWASNAYPLIDLHLTRRDCEQIIHDADLLIPEKSACDVCPHRTPAGWAYLKQRDPAAFAYAVATEQRFPGQFLSSQRKPLPIVAAEAESVMDLFDGGDCTSGHCFG